MNGTQELPGGAAGHRLRGVKTLPRLAVTPRTEK